MKAGMWIAIIFGVVALIFGIAVAFIFGAVSGVAGAMNESRVALASGLVAFLLVAMPVVAIVGGALAQNNPKIARFLTGVPGVLIAALGFTDPSNGIALIVLGGGLVLAAFLIHRGHQAATAPAKEQS